MTAFGGAQSAQGLLQGGLALSPLGMFGGLAALDFAGMGASFGFGQAAQGRQWDKWKDSQTRGPLYKLIGLEQAGLNPILAAKGGLGGAGGFTGSAVASGGQAGSSGAKFMEQLQRSPLYKAETLRAGAQARQSDATAGREHSQAALNNAQNNLVNTNALVAEYQATLSALEAEAKKWETDARIGRAQVEQNLNRFYLDNPNVRTAKDMAFEAAAGLGAASSFLRSFPIGRGVGRRPAGARDLPRGGAGRPGGRFNPKDPSGLRERMPSSWPNMGLPGAKPKVTPKASKKSEYKGWMP